MNLERVIELLSIEKECVSRNCDRNCEVCDLSQDRSELLKAYKIAIQELKYRLSKKITHEATRSNCPTCPSCGNIAGDEIMLIGRTKLHVQTKYCHFCGQFFDWSDLKKEKSND
ncbi:MAG: hypothetical protein IKN04_03345 [Clostridia bacterium]|nr:hypothetical protein [Clostridia bacterium]